MLAGTRGGSWLIRLAAPPVDGAANAELIAFLAYRLGLPKRAITITHGETARQKRVKIVGLSAATIQARLTAPHDDR